MADVPTLCFHLFHIFNFLYYEIFFINLFSVYYTGYALASLALNYLRCFALRQKFMPQKTRTHFCKKRKTCIAAMPIALSLHSSYARKPSSKAHCRAWKKQYFSAGKACQALAKCYAVGGGGKTLRIVGAKLPVLPLSALQSVLYGI